MLTRPRRTGRDPGYTLVEMAIVVLVAAVVSMVALPSFQDAVRRSRRSDALAGIALVQQAQERHRAQHPGYATALGGADGLGLPALSPAGHYDLATTAPPEAATRAYRVTATARGPQAADTECRWIAVEIADGILRERSGPDARLANPDDVTRRCWRR